MQKQVQARYGIEIGLPVVRWADLITDLSTTVSYYTYKPGTSLAIEIALMKAWAAQVAKGRFLEIGAYLGEATANLADTGTECVSVSLGDIDMQKLGFGAHIKANRFFIKNRPNVRNIDANTHTYSFDGLGRFDLVFIDGDHTYEGVLNDTQKITAKCADENTLIFWHDYADKAGVRWPVLAAILDGLPAQYRKRLFYLENTLSAVYIPASMPLPQASPFDPTEPPTHYLEMGIRLKKA